MSACTLQEIIESPNLTNGEKITTLLEHPSIRNQKPPSNILQITADDCQLDKDDLKCVFEKFGIVRDVMIESNGKASVVMEEGIAAFVAQKIMDGRVFDGTKLIVEFCKRKIGKFTCRYDICIENEKEFQVARRIIGSKGCNMKRIIDVCTKEQISLGNQNNKDIVKLRLRGKGSGYREGPDKLESHEPLHLCVSSRYYDVFHKACMMVEELLQKIYEEFGMYQKNLGKNGVVIQKVKKYESLSSKSTKDNMMNDDLL